jgi:hypothetical protein
LVLVLVLGRLFSFGRRGGGIDIVGGERVGGSADEKVGSVEGVVVELAARATAAAEAGGSRVGESENEGTAEPVDAFAFGVVCGDDDGDGDASVNDGVSVSILVGLCIVTEGGVCTVPAPALLTGS